MTTGVWASSWQPGIAIATYRLFTPTVEFKIAVTFELRPIFELRDIYATLKPNFGSNSDRKFLLETIFT
jgi:hypothetical protein